MCRVYMHLIVHSIFFVTEIGRTVCVTTGGTRGDLWAKRDTIVFTGRSYRLDASHGWLNP